jgi:NADH dehydrogenase
VSTTDAEHREGRKKVVVVGGGFGGVQAAKALGHADVDVTVVDRTNHHLFQTTCSSRSSTRSRRASCPPA